jgi:hypothetical protein
MVIFMYHNMLHSSAGLLTQSLIPFESSSFISPELKQGTFDTISSPTSHTEEVSEFTNVTASKLLGSPRFLSEFYCVKKKSQSEAFTASYFTHFVASHTKSTRTGYTSGRSQRNHKHVFPPDPPRLLQAVVRSRTNAG